MRVDLVVNRDGKAAVNWLGVLAVSAIVAAISFAVFAVFMFATGWFSLTALILVVALCVGGVVGSCVQRSWQLPVDRLPAPK
jgi:hypothetical protein